MAAAINAIAAAMLQIDSKQPAAAGGANNAASSNKCNNSGSAMQCRITVTAMLLQINAAAAMATAAVLLHSAAANGGTNVSNGERRWCKCQRW